MKKIKTIYWVTTIIIVLWESVMPALTSHTQLAIDGIRNLGYPDYFRVLLTIFKVTGGFLLIIPAVSSRLKEWAYAGFGFTFIFAAASNWIVYGFGFGVILALLLLAILAISYFYYHKVQSYSFHMQRA